MQKKGILMIPHLPHHSLCFLHFTRPDEPTSESWSCYWVWLCHLLDTQGSDKVVNMVIAATVRIWGHPLITFQESGQLSKYECMIWNRHHIQSEIHLLWTSIGGRKQSPHKIYTERSRPIAMQCSELLDVNGTDISRLYSNSIWSGRVFYLFVSDSEYSISVTDPYSNTQKLHFYDVDIHCNLIRQKLALFVFEQKYEKTNTISVISVCIRSVYLPNCTYQIIS